MRERAEQLGGHLEFTSNEIGLRLMVVFPLVHSNEENANIVGG
jgi:signal transduction histidine kinase